MADFKLPELGEDIQEADVIKILVAEGDVVEATQPLIEIETEKATVEVPADAAGTVVKIHVREGDTITVGQLIVTIESAAAATVPTRQEPDEPKLRTTEEAPPGPA